MTEDNGTGTAPVKTIGGGGGALVGAAAGFSALVGLVVLAITPHVLTKAENSDFLIYWSALFAVFGVLSGLSIEMTRSLAAARTMADPAGPRVRTVGFVAVAVIAPCGLATLPWWRSALLPPRDNLLLALLLCTGAVGYAVHSVVVGGLAGVGRWTTYAAVITAESAVRLLLIIAAVVTGAHFGGLAAGAALGTFTWIVALAVSPRVRAVLASRTDASPRTIASRMLAAVVAQGLSALLVVGFPLLLQATTPRAVIATAAPLMLAITLTRAPLMIPLNAYQGVAVAHFVRNRHRGLASALPAVRLLAGVGLVGAALAYLLGPTLMVVFSGQESYRMSGITLAGLTLGATLVALLTLSGALCQALSLHRWFVSGWIAADVTAIVVLATLPWSMEARTICALAAAPLVGIAVHAVGLVRAGHAGRTQPKELDLP